MERVSPLANAAGGLAAAFFAAAVAFGLPGPRDSGVVVVVVTVLPIRAWI